MAILINDVAPRVRYTATSLQQTFSVPFEWLAITDLKVYRNGTLLTYDATPVGANEYSVTGTSVTGGGTISLGSPYATLADDILIIRDMPLDRLTDFAATGAFPISALNEELDGFVAKLQQVEVYLDRRALRLAVTDLPETMSALPVRATRSEKLLSFDTNGNPETVHSPSSIAAAAFLTGLLGSSVRFLGDWLTATLYAFGDMVSVSGASYICTVGHTSAALTEPGIGASWTTRWVSLSAPSDPEIAAIAALVSAADKVPYFTGSGTAALGDLTAAGRALIAGASATAQRTTLGLGALATLAVVGTAQITDANVTTAKITDDAVTKAKLEDVATTTIRGRITAGTGDPEDLTPAQARTVLAVAEALTVDRTYHVRAALPAPTFTGASANVTMTAHGLSANDPVVLAVPQNTTTVTITAASPAVVTRTAHGFAAGRPIRFRSTGYLPTGITAGTTYYVIATGLATDTFQFSATVGGAAIATTAISSSFSSGSATITSGSAHGLVVGQLVRFAGSVATNFSAGVDYYVVSTGTATTFTVSATNGGTAISAGSTVSGGTVVQTGTHYCDTVGAMPTFSTAGLLVAGTTYYVGTVVDANTVTLSTTLSNANPLGTATLATGSPIYAAATGNDSNNGLAATRSGALLTVQAAINLATAININGYNLVIQLADGVYTPSITLKEIIGYSAPGCLKLKGNTTTPRNVSFNTSAASVTISSINCVWDVEGVWLVTSSGALITVQSAKARIANCDFGLCTGNYQIQVATASGVALYGPVTISDGALNFVSLFDCSVFRSAVQTHTFVGVPAFSGSFCSSQLASSAGYQSTTFVGSATGSRYVTATNGILNTNGGGANYLPGNSAGSTATGGQYT